MQKINIHLLIRIYEKIFHKDPMNWRIAKYRLDGANIGENVRAFSPITSTEPYLITIGNNVTVSTGVKFCTHDNSAIKIFKNGTDFVGAINIAANSFIGMNSIIMGGVTIPENCIIGAGSVVTKSFQEPGIVIAGNPAKKIGTVDEIYAKNRDNVFNFKGMSFSQKKEEIMANPQKWLKK